MHDFGNSLRVAAAPPSKSPHARFRRLSERFALDGLGHFIGRKYLAEIPLDLRHDGAGPCRDVGHSTAENAVDANEHAVAGLDQVDDARLHAGTSCAADGQRQLVARAKDGPQHPLCFVHDSEEIGIEVPDGRSRQSSQHARRHVAGARPHQNATGRTDSGRQGQGHNVLLNFLTARS